MNREQGKNKLYMCPCCGYATLTTVAAFEICDICYWEDDGQDTVASIDLTGSPNGVSLSEARRNFKAIGAAERKDMAYTRSPHAQDVKIMNFN